MLLTHAPHLIFVSLTSVQDAIKVLIMARFDKFTENAAPETNGHEPATNGETKQSMSIEPSPPAQSKKRPAEDETGEDEPVDVKHSPASPKKKKTDYDSDAAFAAKLQAQENSRARATRGGGVTKKAAPVKKKVVKKKTSTKVRAEDDSDLDDSGTEAKEKKVNRNGGFHVNISLRPFGSLQTATCADSLQQKELYLSAPLSALLNNETKVSKSSFHKCNDASFLTT